MNLVYASDLHLEFNPYRSGLTMPDADYMMFAGDITSAAVLGERKNDAASRAAKNRFLSILQQTQKYKKVFYVMGNHEHYSTFFGDTKAGLELFIRKYSDNWVLLDNDCISIDPETVVVGATLWTDYDNGNPISMMACKQGMNDYSYIMNKKTGNPIRPEDILVEHMDSYDYIKKICELNRERKIILLTHHPMSYEGINQEHSGDTLSAAFASKLDEFYHYNPNVVVHIHGHTHVVKDYQIANTKIYSNACGYFGMEDMYNTFQYKVIEL